MLVGARRLEITERVGWIAVDRRSARVHADRRSVQAEWEEGRPKHQLRGLVAMDVSSSGCRLSGIGSPPPAGANLRLDISGTTYGESQWLSAQVMRVETSAFGRYLLGLRFGSSRRRTTRGCSPGARHRCAGSARDRPIFG